MSKAQKAEEFPLLPFALLSALLTVATVAMMAGAILGPVAFWRMAAMSIPRTGTTIAVGRRPMAIAPARVPMPSARVVTVRCVVFIACVLVVGMSAPTRVVMLPCVVLSLGFVP
ncbi:MAG TPA: hypothetical protein VHC22_04890 [Pirellulales bacterium]|nr:hypothetical protein [Pirellulales bacterium]